MKKFSRFRKVFLLILLLSFCSQMAFAQEELSKNAYEIEFGGSYMKAGLSYNVRAKFVHDFNPILGVSAGFGVYRSYIDYSINEKHFEDNLYSLEGIIGIKLSSPTYKHFGLTSDVNFLFEPIPVANITIGYPKEDNVKYVYTEFNPGFEIQGGIFYEKEHVRFVLGGGVSNYNPYFAYYKYAGDKSLFNKNQINVFFRIYGVLSK